MSEQRSLQKHFFGVLNQITHNNSHPLIALIFILLYMAELILSLLILTNTNHIEQTIFTSSIFTLIALSLFALIFMQLLVAIVYGIQAQLYLQLVFYRFVLFPIIMLFLSHQIQSQSFISKPLGQVYYCALTLLTYFANFVIHSYASHSIFRIFEASSSWFVITDSLLFLVSALTSFAYILMALLFILSINIMLRYKLQNYEFNDKNEQYEYFTLNIKDLVVAILLWKETFLVRVNPLLLIILVAPLLLFIFFIEFGRRRVRKLNRQVFGGKTGLGELFEFASLMSQQLLRFRNQDIDLSQSLLVVFIAIHRKQCVDSGCLLSQKSTEQQIKNGNQWSNLKIIKHKIIKKLEYIFQLYEQVYHDSIQLKFLLISFYLNHLPNRIKLNLIIASINPEQLSWDQRLVLFGFSSQIKRLLVDTDLVIEASKTEDQYTQFKKIMINAVNCFQQFWAKILQQKVDVNQLILISQKLFPLKKCIEQIWKKHLNSQKFSSWSILKAYTYYRRSIMHDYSNSAILQGYCNIIEKRLQQKHEMGYINSQTEQAVITISLTESSLGNICSLNKQVCKIFNFSNKAELLELRINHIMPSVFSAIHDNILNSFLKNRFKSVNQDQKHLFGKNKNGFIFPILIELRKLSWNSNDQLIFIAQLELPKVRAAPILCISDLQGDILDYTSAFAWLFVKKSKNNSSIQSKNIQEIIPSFFESIENMEGPSSIIHFAEKVRCSKLSQIIQIQFNARELFIRKEKVGYLIEGVQIQTFQTLRGKMNINEILTRYYEQNQIFNNSYNPYQLCYQMTNYSQKRATSQFSIPFIKASEIQHVLTFKEKSKNYGEKIKTCRLFQGRLEHVPEQESFYSDQQSDFKEFSIIKKIERLKDELSVRQTSHLGNSFKATIIFMNILMLGMIGLVFNQMIEFEHGELQMMQKANSQLKVRQLFPQYLTYTLYPSVSTQERTLSLRDELHQNLIRAGFEQGQKQQILQLIYSTPFTNRIQFSYLLLHFTYDSNNIYSGIVIVWSLTAAICFVYAVILILIYLIFKWKMSNIYSVFVSLDDNKLTNIKSQAQKILEFLNFKNLQLQSEHVQMNDLGQAEFHRIKKMKNNYSVEDIVNISKLVFPSCLILAYSILGCIMVSKSLDNYKVYVDGWQRSAQFLPSSSIQLLSELVSQNGLGSVSIGSSYWNLQKSFQYQMISIFPNQGSLFQLIKGDACNLPLFYHTIGVNVDRFCLNSTSFYQYSFSHMTNYLSTMLANQNKQNVEWPQLISIQFQFLKPVLKYLSRTLEGQLTALRHESEKNMIILGIIHIFLTIVFCLYVLLYPIRQIYEKILFTTDLIKILPTNKRKNPQEALAAMTTQAMDFS